MAGRRRSATAKARLEALRDYFARDPFNRFLGVELVELGDGFARTALTLRPELLNFQGAGHGGAIFSLADAAFGAASNSHGRVAVGLVTTMHYVAPTAAGDRLEAVARLEHLGGHTALYAITVTRGDGALVASGQGVVYRKDQGHPPALGC